MSTDDKITYIDVTNGIPEVLPQGQKICFVFLPDFDYAGMNDAERAAREAGFAFLNIPITLPVLDLVKQMEFAGAEITSGLTKIPGAIRQIIMGLLREDRCSVHLDGHCNKV